MADVLKMAVAALDRAKARLYSGDETKSSAESANQQKWTAVRQNVASKARLHDGTLESYIERKDSIDTRRSAVFLLFGLVQVGWVQYHHNHAELTRYLTAHSKPKAFGSSREASSSCSHHSLISSRATISSP